MLDKYSHNINSKNTLLYGVKKHKNVLHLISAQSLFARPYFQAVYEKFTQLTLVRILQTRFPLCRLGQTAGLNVVNQVHIYRKSAKLSRQI